MMALPVWHPRPLPVLGNNICYPPVDNLPSAVSPRDILFGWKSQGMAWLAALGRTELRGVLSRLCDRPESGLPRLYQNGEFLGRLLAVAEEKLAPARAAKALLGAIVQVWPVPQVLVPPLRRWARAAWKHRSPSWDCDDFQRYPADLWCSLEQELVRKGGGLSPAEVEGAMALLSLPPTLWQGDWAEQVVKAGAARLEGGSFSQASVALLLQLCDRNSLLSVEAPISPLHQRLIRAVVAGGQAADNEECARAAERLLARIGSGADYPERWRGLEEEQRVLNGWLLEGFMARLWGPLSGLSLRRPVGKRQDLWALYPSAMAEVTLIVSPEMRDRLARGPEAKVLESVKGIVNIASCGGLGKDGCALWVVLREGRRAATVLEWGRIGRFHLRTGAHSPGQNLKTAQSLGWAGWEDSMNATEGWEAKFREKLRLYGVHAVDSVPARQAA
jgi:hypothetical protein